MCRLRVAVWVMLLVVALVTTLYWSYSTVTNGPSLATKGLAQSKGLSVREAECHLDVDLFLGEYSWWKAGEPHHPFILQRMFLHAVELGQKEMEQVIHQGCQQRTPGLDARVDVPAVQFMGYETAQGKIQELYNEVYQL